jgi:hypothetical protein
MKAFAIVHPAKTSSVDRKHDHYDYPDYSRLIQRVICWNRTLDDFLTEQVWSIEGSAEDVEEFLNYVPPSFPNAVQISEAEVSKLKEEWAVERILITDAESVIRAVLDLKAKGIELPASLDPDLPDAGIQRRRS